MTPIKKLKYRIFQWTAKKIGSLFEQETKEVSLPSRRNELAAEAMHVLTQAVEATVSEFRTPAIEETAKQVLAMLAQCMAGIKNDEEEHTESIHLLQQAANQASSLETQGYQGYAQALGNAVTFNYLIPPGVTEGLVLPELLRSYGTKVEAPLAQLAREAGIVALDLPDDRTARLFISWIEQQRKVLGLPEYIKQLRQADIEDIIDDAFEDATPMYPVPVFYDAIDLEQFLTPLLASNKSKID